MTYHLERTFSLPTNFKTDFDRKVRFPEKLWEVMEDPSPILHWSTDGTAIVANEQLFEDKVMKRYPGLVQISSFLNYRRQLREYGFDWAVAQKGEFQFSHPSFIRGRPELIRGVTTKRKSYGGCHSHSTTEMTPSEGGTSGGGRGRGRTRGLSRLVNTSHSAPTQIEVVGVAGRRDDCGFMDCAPMKIIKLSVGNASGLSLRDENGASPGSVDAWSLCSPSPITQMKRFQVGDTCNSDSSGRYPVSRVYATRNSARLRELRDRMPDRLSTSVATSYADNVQTFPATSLTSPRSHDWWMYCAPWGPSEEGLESMSEARNIYGATDCMDDRYSFDDGYRPNTITIQPKVNIPVYFYDDGKPANLAELVENDDSVFGLEGQPRATPVDDQLNDSDCHEIRYYFAL